MIEELIPIVMFIVIGVVLWLMFHFRYKTRAEMQQTIRMALEKGADLTPELIDRLGDPEPHKDKDLRRGLIWLALAIALAMCGVAIPDSSGDALRGCLAGAAFPFAIGVAFMIMWVYGNRQDRAS